MSYTRIRVGTRRDGDGGVADLVLRHGTVVDGSGREPFVADLAITGERITGIGPRLGPAARSIDATGLLVTPGFVDPHSHLDGAVVWESRLVPDSGHGITTTVVGNCGVGFAPCREPNREFVIDLMEGVEDIPRSALELGLPWTWTTHPDYLQVVAAGRFDIDVASLLPHSLLRLDVMGERALTGEPATTADLDRLSGITDEALAAGAIGIGSTRLVGQTTRDGRPSPSRFATEAEYLTLAAALVDAGHGLLQVAPEFNRFPLALDELAMLIRVAETTGVTVTYTLKQTNATPDGWRRLLDLTAEARSRGVRIHPQVLARPTGAVVGWETSRHRFSRCPSYRALADLPLDERLTELRRPAVRARIVAEAGAGGFADRLDLMFPLGAVPHYEPDPSDSIAALAASSGRDPAELLYDAYLADDGKGSVLVTSGNYADGNLDAAAEMLAFDGAIPGLGDAGAHCSVICDASATTSTLAYWTRHRTRGRRFTVPFVVKRLTADIADVFGLADRGRIGVGARADLNVIDHDRLGLHRPRMTYDLPGGGRRLVQDADGYVATIVGGQLVVDHDHPTDALPGRLVRS